MKKNTLFYFYITLGFIFVTSCTQSTYDDIEADAEPLPEIVTYLDIKPIIDGNCLSCHGNPTQNGAPMSLVTYENVKEAVTNRDLLGRINKNQGEDGFMPQGGSRLSQFEIELISKWDEDGLLEN